VDTDAKRRERFLNGLNDELKVQFSMINAANYQALLDKATILENKQHHMKNRKRRHNHKGNGNSHHKRYVHEHHDHQNYTINSGSGNGKRNGHVKGRKSNKRDLSHVECYNCKELGNYSWGCPEKKIGAGIFNGIADQNHRNSNKRDISQVECYKCKKLRHYSWDYPKNKNTTGNSNGNKPNPFKKRHMNYVNMEEVFEVPNAANHKF
jgi:hypothetical protein